MTFSLSHTSHSAKVFGHALVFVFGTVNTWCNLFFQIFFTEKSARKPPPLGVGRKRGLLYLTS